VQLAVHLFAIKRDGNLWMRIVNSRDLSKRVTGCKQSLQDGWQNLDQLSATVRNCPTALHACIACMALAHGAGVPVLQRMLQMQVVLDVLQKLARRAASQAQVEELQSSLLGEMRALMEDLRASQAATGEQKAEAVSSVDSIATLHQLEDEYNAPRMQQAMDVLKGARDRMGARWPEALFMPPGAVDADAAASIWDACRVRTQPLAASHTPCWLSRGA
jgi:hypothetical protein